MNDISSMLPPPEEKPESDGPKDAPVTTTSPSMTSENQPETSQPSVTGADLTENVENTPPVPTSDEKVTDNSQTVPVNETSQDTSPSRAEDGNEGKAPVSEQVAVADSATGENTAEASTTANTDPKDASSADSTPTITVKSPADKYQEVTDMLFSRLSDVGSDAHFKCMIYGPPGGTKSTMLDVPNNLIYDQEDGLISMKAWAKKNGRSISPGIKALPFTSFVQADLLIDRLIQQVDEVKQFEVFSIDTFNDFHRKALMEVVAKYHKNAPNSINRWVPETAHHQENNERMLDIVRKLRDLPMDIIITAHSKTVEPKNSLPKTYPDFSESLANKIEGMMDLVGYVEMREIDGNSVPVMRVVSNGMIHAKNRMNLPAEIMNPTWQQLKTAWQNTVGAQ